MMRNTYYDRLAKILTTKMITDRDEILINITNDFTWIIIGIDDLANSIKAIPLAIDRYIKDYELQKFIVSINEAEDLLSLRHEVNKKNKLSL